MNPEGSTLYVPAPLGGDADKKTPKKKKRKRKKPVARLTDEIIQKNRALRAARAAERAADWIERLHARDLQGKFKDMPDMPERDRNEAIKMMGDLELAQLARQALDGDIKNMKPGMMNEIRNEVRSRRENRGSRPLQMRQNTQVARTDELGARAGLRDIRDRNEKDDAVAELQNRKNNPAAQANRRERQRELGQEVAGRDYAADQDLRRLDRGEDQSDPVTPFDDAESITPSARNDEPTFQTKDLAPVNDVLLAAALQDKDLPDNQRRAIEREQKKRAAKVAERREKARSLTKPKSETPDLPGPDTRREMDVERRQDEAKAKAEKFLLRDGKERKLNQKQIEAVDNDLLYAIDYHAKREDNQNLIARELNGRDDRGELDADDPKTETGPQRIGAGTREKIGNEKEKQKTFKVMMEMIENDSRLSDRDKTELKIEIAQMNNDPDIGHETMWEDGANLIRGRLPKSEKKSTEKSFEWRNRMRDLAGRGDGNFEEFYAERKRVAEELDAEVKNNGRDGENYRKLREQFADLNVIADEYLGPWPDQALADWEKEGSGTREVNGVDAPTPTPTPNKPDAKAKTPDTDAKEREKRKLDAIEAKDARRAAEAQQPGPDSLAEIKSINDRRDHQFALQIWEKEKAKWNGKGNYYKPRKGEATQAFLYFDSKDDPQGWADFARLYTKPESYLKSVTDVKLDRQRDHARQMKRRGIWPEKVDRYLERLDNVLGKPERPGNKDLEREVTVPTENLKNAAPGALQMAGDVFQRPTNRDKVRREKRRRDRIALFGRSDGYGNKSKDTKPTSDTKPTPKSGSGNTDRRDYRSHVEQARENRRQAVANGQTKARVIRQAIERDNKNLGGKGADRNRVPWKKLDPEGVLNAQDRKIVRSMLGADANDRAFIAAVKYKKANGALPRERGELARAMELEQLGIEIGLDRRRARRRKPNLKERIVENQKNQKDHDAQKANLYRNKVKRLNNDPVPEWIEGDDQKMIKFHDENVKQVQNLEIARRANGGAIDHVARGKELAVIEDVINDLDDDQKLMMEARRMAIRQQFFDELDMNTDEMNRLVADGRLLNEEAMASDAKRFMPGQGTDMVIDMFGVARDKKNEKLNDAIFAELRMRGFDEATIMAMRDNHGKGDLLGNAQLRGRAHPDVRIQDILTQLRATLDPEDRNRLQAEFKKQEAIRLDRRLQQSDPLDGYIHIDIDNDFEDLYAISEFLDYISEGNGNAVVILPDNWIGGVAAAMAFDRGLHVKRSRKGVGYQGGIKKERPDGALLGDGPWIYAALRVDPDDIMDGKENVIDNVLLNDDFGGADFEAINIFPGWRGESDFGNPARAAVYERDDYLAIYDQYERNGAKRNREIDRTLIPGVIKQDSPDGVVLGSAYNHVEVDYNVPADGPEGHFAESDDGPFPHAIRAGTPAADHFEAGGGLDDAPEDGLFDYIFQQVGYVYEGDGGRGLKPGEEGIQRPGRGHYRPKYASADASRFKIVDGPSGVSPNYFVIEMDENGNQVGWKMFKGSSGWFEFDIEREVFASRVMKAASVVDRSPEVKFGRKKTHKGPRWNVSQNGIFAAFPEATHAEIQSGKYTIDNGASLRDPSVLRGDRKAILQAMIFDYLTGNGDRHPNNWMYARNNETGETRFIQIDNGGGVPHNAGSKFGYLQGSKWVRNLYDGEGRALESDLRELVAKFDSVDTNDILRDIGEGGSDGLIRHLREQSEAWKKSMRNLKRYTSENRLADKMGIA